MVIPEFLWLAEKFTVFPAGYQKPFPESPCLECPFFQLILLQDFIRLRKCLFFFFFLVSLVLFSSPLAGKGEPKKEEDPWAFCQSGEELFYKLNLNWWVWGMREIIPSLNLFFFLPSWPLHCKPWGLLFHLNLVGPKLICKAQMLSYSNSRVIQAGKSFPNLTGSAD